MLLRPLTSTVFPYTTLFRSEVHLCATHFCKVCDATLSFVVQPLGLAPPPTSVALFQTRAGPGSQAVVRSEEHTSELQSPCNLVCRLLLEKKKNQEHIYLSPT